MCMLTKKAIKILKREYKNLNENIRPISKNLYFAIFGKKFGKFSAPDEKKSRKEACNIAK